MAKHPAVLELGCKEACITFRRRLKVKAQIATYRTSVGPSDIGWYVLGAKERWFLDEMIRFDGIFFVQFLPHSIILRHSLDQSWLTQKIVITLVDIYKVIPFIARDSEPKSE